MKLWLFSVNPFLRYSPGSLRSTNKNMLIRNTRAFSLLSYCRFGHTVYVEGFKGQLKPIIRECIGLSQNMVPITL